MPALVLRSCVPLLLSALLLCAWCVGLKYAFIWRFKGVFRGFWGCCVGLCCLGGLRGLCGFCTRVELGGLKACGVFAPCFILLLCLLSFRFSLFLCVCPAFVLVSLCLLSFACSLVLSFLSCFVFVFSFSLSVYAQKERAQRFCSLRPLLSCCGFFTSP